MNQFEDTDVVKRPGGPRGACNEYMNRIYKERSRSQRRMLSMKRGAASRADTLAASRLRKQARDGATALVGRKRMHDTTAAAARSGSGSGGGIVRARGDEAMDCLEHGGDEEQPAEKYRKVCNMEDHPIESMDIDGSSDEGRGVEKRPRVPGRSTTTIVEGRSAAVEQPRDDDDTLRDGGAKKRRRILYKGDQTPSDAPFKKNTPTKDTGWIPPVSPYGLLEEELYHSPWKLMISCILLNKTTASQVRSVIWKLFDMYPTPQNMIEAETTALQDLLEPLGLHRKRATTLQRFSKEFLDKDWSKDPTMLHGVGKYANDAYSIFCKGTWQSVQPEDKDLKLYLEFLNRTEGMGVGFSRPQSTDQ